MNCPRCGCKVENIDTRNNGARVRRRKRCNTCGFTFTTYEVYEGDITSPKAFMKGWKKDEQA